MGCYELTGKGFGTKKRPGFLCTGPATPPGDKECLEVIWSNGRACRKCEVDCYRRGWLKAAVDRDNARFIAKKNQAILDARKQEKQ